ncbi:MAG: hypothetical protein WC071_00325 [Victivallaceae bacterium]
MQKTVEETIRIHDKYQFEIKYTYPLDREQPVTEYTVETFIFLPNNLGINQLSYSKNDFYRDMQKYIRLKTPVFRLASIVNGADNPLEKVKQTVAALGHNANEHTVAEYSYHLKMFCSILKSAIRDEEFFIENHGQEPGINALIESFLKDVKHIVKSFRELKEIIQEAHIDHNNFSFYSFSDEYISLIVEKYLYLLLIFLKQHKTVTNNKIPELIIQVINSELEHRKINGYPAIASSAGNNEEVIYRLRILKKIMGSILFLTTHTKVEGRLLEQIATGVAAGVAMAFATGFVFLSRNTLQDLTLSLFLGLVISYIFKDRIKELSKLFLLSWLRKYVYDYKTVLCTAMDAEVGFCRESFAFVPDEKLLPPEIIKIRNKDYIGKLDNGYAPENIIYSKKQIKVFQAACEKIFSDFQVDGIHDIIRFNVSGFLNKMDNPRKILFVPDGSDNYRKIKGDCVYHLNMILKYGMDGNIKYHKFRIVLSRSGIKRIVEIPCDNQ